MKTAPHTTRVRRLDEVGAARKPILRWDPSGERRQKNPPPRTGKLDHRRTLERLITRDSLLTSTRPALCSVLVSLTLLLRICETELRLQPVLQMTPALNAWLPKSVLLLRDYDRHKFLSDLIAGITVGLVALPLAMAFAIASGVTPQAGIYCAIVTGFLISALGGSKTQIGGPTGAFVVVVSGIIAKYGIDGLFTCTMMAGVLLVLLGVTGMGTRRKIFPATRHHRLHQRHRHPDRQHADSRFLRIANGSRPRRFLPSHGRVWPGMAHAFRCPQRFCRIVSLDDHDSLPEVREANSRRDRRHFRRYRRRRAAASAGRDDRDALRRHPERPAHVSRSRSFTTTSLRQLLSPAFTVAMLGAIESLMSAVVSDRMSNDKHNPNVELMAQGVANIVSPLFGGLPATGAIARTATNVRSGAKTPVAGMIHALTLLAIVLFAAPLVKNVPLAALAAILMIVAYNMGEWQRNSRDSEADRRRHHRLAADPDADCGRRSDLRGRSRHGARPR